MSDDEKHLAHGAGPLGVALRWLITSTAGTWVLAVATVLGVWMCGDLVPALILVHAPLSLLAGACAALAAARPARSEAALRAGHRALGLLCLSALAAFLFSFGDWVHSLWSIEYPLFGLLFGSGLVLVRIWPEDRKLQPNLLRGWSGATLAFVTVGALGALPLLLTVLPFDVRPLARESGPLLATFFEVVRYGFGGAVPALMEPVSSYDAARGLGIAPRIVTVTMGASLLATVHWILFATLALVGRVIPVGRGRRVFFLIAPMILALAALFLVAINSEGNMDRSLYRGIWRNEPWLVRAYGPTLLVALVATAGLFLAVRRDGRAEGRAK